MRIRPSYLVIVFLLFLAAVELLFTVAPVSYEKKAGVMGTTARVKIVGPGAPLLVNYALFEIKRLDGLFSKFDEKSEISLINFLSGKAPLQTSTDTFKVMEMAVEVNHLSGGAFDVTLGHPEDIVLNKGLRTVFLKKEATKIDLGGIGKGYAVEAARRLLLRKRVGHAMIDMHSSLAVIGDGWKIGVQDPQDKNKVLGTVVLNDGESLSTSGGYEQPGHILDPRSGKSADKCLSVTVITKDAGFADALSTAIFVLGPVEGLRLARSLKNVKTIIVAGDGIIYDNFGFKLR